MLLPKQLWLWAEIFHLFWGCNWIICFNANLTMKSKMWHGHVGLAGRNPGLNGVWLPTWEPHPKLVINFWFSPKIELNKQDHVSPKPVWRPAALWSCFQVTRVLTSTAQAHIYQSYRYFLINHTASELLMDGIRGQVVKVTGMQSLQLIPMSNYVCLNPK